MCGRTSLFVAQPELEERFDATVSFEYEQRYNIAPREPLTTIRNTDPDHIGGHAAVIEYFETNGEGVGAVYDPGIASSSATYDEYLDAIDAHNVTLYRSQAGDSMQLRGTEARILAPPEGYLADRDSNENSIVVHLQFGASSFLLPGDGEAASEGYLVESYGDALNSTVLAVGHHGSQSSTSEAFLDAVSPRAAVISSAYDSQYGHPHEEVLSRLAGRLCQA